MAHETDDVGAAITALPEEENVSKWREFLKRPENLATGLVLLAGITGPRGRGQSKLNKALTSGVGALGFRGGLEKGIEASRADLREEGRTIEAQDADIAAQQAATQVAQGQLAVGQGNLAVNQQTAGINQQLANQAGAARPLPQSEIALNEARANAFNRDPDIVPNDFASLFERNKAQFLENNLGAEPNMAELALQTTRELVIRRIAEEGRITAGGLDVTPEEAAILGIELPEVEGGDTDTDGNIIKTPSELDIQNKAIGDSLRIGGQFGRPSAAGQTATVTLLRKDGDFSQLEDEQLLDSLAEVRSLLRDEGRLQTTPTEELEEIRSTYLRGLSKKEKRLLQHAINAQRGLPGSQRLFDEAFEN